MSKIFGIIQISIASICFGFLGVFGKLALQNNLSIGELLTYRFILATILFWLFAILFKPSLIRLPLRQIILSILLGIFGYAVFSSLYFEAIKGVSIAVASMLLYTFPFWVNVISHFIQKEHVSKFEWFLLLTALGGLAMLLWGKITVSNSWAVTCGALSGLTYALYIVVSEKYQKNINPFSSSLYVITSASVALLLFHMPDLNRLPHLNIIQNEIILGIALFCTVIAISLTLAGIQKLKKSQAVIVTMLEPLTASFAGFIFFNQSLSYQQLFGISLILASIAIISIKK